MCSSCYDMLFVCSLVNVCVYKMALYCKCAKGLLCILQTLTCSQTKTQKHELILGQRLKVVFFQGHWRYFIYGLHLTEVQVQSHELTNISSITDQTPVIIFWKSIEIILDTLGWGIHKCIHRNFKPQSILFNCFLSKVNGDYGIQLEEN